MIEVAEAKRLSPLIDTDGLLAAAYSPTDGHCTPESVVLGYAGCGPSGRRPLWRGTRSRASSATAQPSPRYGPSNTCSVPLLRLIICSSPGIGLERIPRFPEDFAALEAAVRETQAALVVIDPMMAFFPPDVCANNNQSICTALLPLSAMAASTGACVLLVRHLRKSGGASAIYRGLGSIGILGAVRTGLMIARHPDDPELRVPHADEDEHRPAGAIARLPARRDEASGQTVVNWTGPLDVTTDDLFGACVPLRRVPHARAPRSGCGSFLRTASAARPKCIEAARAAGIPDRTLKRVKATVGVKSDAVNTDGKIEWWWRDPKAEYIQRVMRSRRWRIPWNASVSAAHRSCRSREAQAATPPPQPPKPPHLTAATPHRGER